MTTPPKWRILGFLLHEYSERYLRDIGEERIDAIRKKLGQEPTNNE